jgi:metal-responsive CopG/Arc/MetJ family transcriptional regulator
MSADGEREATACGEIPFMLTLDPPPNRGYTPGMKTAVSIPDRVFEATEQLAQSMGKSRSEVYSLALAEYVARHAPEQVTEAFDRVCSALEEGTDEFVSAAARRLLERTQW